MDINDAEATRLPLSDQGTSCSHRADLRNLQDVLKAILDNADILVKKSIHYRRRRLGYDIGYGSGHAASGAVNVLVLDTEVYSNTGGQAQVYSDGRSCQFASAAAHP